MLHFLTSDIDTVAIRPCISLVEHTVFSGHLKVVTPRSAVEIHPFLATLESHHSRVAPKLHTAVDGKVGQSLHTVCVGQGQKSQPFAGFPFLSGMNAIFQSCVQQHGHAGFGDKPLSLLLLFAKQGTIVRPVDEAVVVGGYLTIIEREGSLLPLGTPPLHHRFHQVGVVGVAVDIVFALIPEDAPHGVTHKRTEHTIVKGRGTTLLGFVYIALRLRQRHRRKSFQLPGGYPSLTGTATPSGHNQPYGHFKTPAECLTKVIGRCTEISDRRSIGRRPTAVHVFCRHQTGRTLHREQP